MHRPVSSFALLVVALLHASLAPVAAGAGRSPASCPAVSDCLSTLVSGQNCRHLLPVPSRSFRRPLAPGTVEITSPRRGVYVYFDGAYLSVILRSASHLVFIDQVDNFLSNLFTGSGTRLTTAMEDILNGTIPSRVDLVYTHAHMDHIGATTRIVSYIRSTYPAAKVDIWGTDEANALAKASTSGKILPPTVIVGEKGKTLKLRKGLKLVMRIVGGHTQQDLLLHIPPSKDGPGIAIQTDIAFPRWAPPFNLAITQDFRRYIAAHRDILNLKFGVYVGGHIRTGTKKDVRESLQYAEDLLEAAKQAEIEVTFEKLREEGFNDSLDPGNVAYGNAWYQFVSVSRRLQIDACYKIVVQKWGCRIGAVDILARGHCFTALQFLTVDL